MRRILRPTRKSKTHTVSLLGATQRPCHPSMWTRRVPQLCASCARRRWPWRIGSTERQPAHAPRPIGRVCVLHEYMYSRTPRHSQWRSILVSEHALRRLWPLLPTLGCATAATATSPTAESTDFQRFVDRQPLSATLALQSTIFTSPPSLVLSVPMHLC